MTRLTIDELEVLTPEELNKLLFDEIWSRSPDIQFIQDILTVGCPTEGMDPDSRTPLQWAAQTGKLEIVKCLVSHGAVIDTQSAGGGLNALHTAAAYGYLEIVKLLVSNGADIHMGTDDGRTALHLAARHDNLEMVEFLLSKGADVNVKTISGWTAWDLACCHMQKIVPELEPK